MDVVFICEIKYTDRLCFLRGKQFHQSSSMFAPHWQFNPQNHTTSRPWQPNISWSRLKAFVRSWVKEYFAGSRLIGLSGMAADKRESSHWLMMRGQSGSPDNQLKRIQCTYANTQKIMFSYQEFEMVVIEENFFWLVKDQGINQEFPPQEVLLGRPF